MNQTTDIARRLSFFREKIGLTQTELAEKVGVSDKVISKWECGETKPSVDVLPALADAFDISIDELFCRTHDCTSDICTSAREYIRATEPSEVIDKIQKVLSHMIIGAQNRQFSEMSCYTPEDVAEITEELLQYEEEGDPRPQIFGEYIDPSRCMENIFNIKNDSLKFAVIQQYTTESRTLLLDKYDVYRPLFEFLAMPGADKILRKAYAGEIPKYVTVDYVSSITEAPAETVTAFFKLIGAEEKIAVIKGEENQIYFWTWWSRTTCFEAVLGAAYLISEKGWGSR